MRFGLSERRLTIGCLARREPLPGQIRPHDFAHHWFVVDNQYRASRPITHGTQDISEDGRGLRQRTTDDGPQTTDGRGPRTTEDHGPQTTDHRPRTTDRRRQTTTDYRLRTAGFGLLISDFGFRISDFLYRLGMRLVGLLVLVVAVTAAACQTASEPEAMLVVVDGEGSVAVIRTDGTAVTEVPAADGQRHFQPIWIDATTIVYATTENQANRLSAIDLDGAEQWSVGYPSPVFFALPSADGTRVATLRSSTDGTPIVAELWSQDDGVQRIGNEAPFYVAWSPDGETLAAHIGAARLETLVPGSEIIEDATGVYQAPYWSPNGLVGLRTVRSDQRMAIWQEGEPHDVATVQGPVRFVGSGNKIAITTAPATAVGEQALAQSMVRIPSGQISIVDLTTGAVTEVSRVQTPMLQWDRGGKKLLFATITEDASPRLQWHVWHDGEIDDYATFRPEASWVREFVPFFDQYATTTFLWSPGGDAFAYPAVIDGQPIVMIQHLGESAPVEASSGSWVSWSR
jgi:TolB protein